MSDATISPPVTGAAPAGAAPNLELVLEAIADSAGRRDRQAAPAQFPHDAVGALEAIGALAFNAIPGVHRPPAGEELALVRAVARADASVGRIFDGHLNGVERLAVQAPDELRDGELALVRAGALRVGVWGGDPRPSEGSPATLSRRGGGETLCGVKTFCSGAGGLHRALVLARDPDAGPPVAVWVDLSDVGSVCVDEGWYQGAGLRASVSHRVVFDHAPVIARFGEPGALALQPWFSRDALRTAASWAGMADRALASALDELALRPGRGPLEALAAGRMLGAVQTIDAWLERVARLMDAAAVPERPNAGGSGVSELAQLAVHARAAIAAACRTLIAEAASACGSHAFATAGGLDRARRDLDLFLLQHRLDGAVAAAGARELAARSGRHS